MSVLDELINRPFIEQLCLLEGSNVLLLLVDGTAVFGRIGLLDDVVRILPALGVAGVAQVQVLPPNSTVVILASEVIIDAHDIIHIVEGPFLVSPIV